MLAAEASPGATAKGLRGATVMLKSCPKADGSRVRKAAAMQIHGRRNRGMPERFWNFNLDFNDSGLNMSRFRFK
jgi:hypothetical protein